MKPGSKSGKKILITGGSGLLGRELLKIDPSLIAPSHKELDITDFQQTLEVLSKYKPDILLHLAAETKPPQHEETPEPGLRVNIIGTANLALACHKLGVRLVYTSTDYIYAGQGPHQEDEPVFAPYRFGWSKLGGEAAVSMLHDFLILRLSFGPAPFPWEKVYEGQYNSKLYVDEAAPLVLAAATSAETGVMNIGGPRKTLEEYARRTKPDIQTIPRPDWVPVDTSMDISKMKKALGIDDELTLFKH